MASIGETFKAAREAKGITIPEAGQATRIKTVQLEALERDDYRKIAAPTYARGFIKLYAQFLHLDAVPLLEEYNARYAKPGTPPAPVSTAKPKGPVAPPARIPPGYAGRKMTEAAAAKAAAENPPPTVRSPPPPEPVRVEVEVPAYAPILPVAGVTPNPAPTPALETGDSASLPLFAYPQPNSEPLPARGFVPLVDTPTPPLDQDRVSTTDDRGPVAAYPSIVVERSPEGQVEAVETFRPNPTPVLPSDEERASFRRTRIRQAVVVVMAVLIFTGILWVIRRLVDDAAPRAGDLQGTSVQSIGLSELPPEPYLEGR